MISVLLLGSSAPAGRAATAADAVRTLGALVSGAVDGAVRDVQLLVTDGADLAAIADHAGCGYVVAADLGAALRAAVAQARAAPLLVLQAGLSFDRALTDEMAGIAGRHDGWLRDGVALKAAENGALGRLIPRWAPTVGVLTDRARLRDTTAADAPRLWRTLRPKRRFEGRAWTGA